MLSAIEDDRIETTRLILRPPAYSDAPALHAMLNDTLLNRFSPHRTMDDVATMHFAIADWQERREQGLRSYVVTYRDRVREPIGLFHVGADEEVGGGISPRHAGRGIGMEAVLAIRKAVGLTNPWAIIDAEHGELIGFLKKVGWAIEKRLPAYRVHPRLSAEPRDCVLMRRSG